MKSMNRKGNKKIAVMAAVIMGFMVIAFMPAASATVTSFTVTPGTGLAGTVDSYNALVTTTGVTSINITIPAGFIAVTPMSGGVEIARVEFWNTSTPKVHYGYATVTTEKWNPTTEVDIHCKFGSDEITTTQDVNYALGATNTFVSGFGSDTSSAIIKFPTETQKGSINLTIDCTAFYLEEVHIAIKQFVTNPGVGNYDFFADGVKETVSITKPSGRGTVFRNGRWFIDTDGDHVADRSFWYGLTADIPVVGNINQFDEGQKDDTIIFRNGKWFVDTTGDHIADDGFWYGIVNDLPVVGDINQDGRDDTVIFRNGKWFVDTDYDHVANDVFEFGPTDYLPVVGDINQDGKDDTILSKNGHWIFDLNYDQVADGSFWFGLTDDIPLVADIDRDGLDDTAVFRDGKWFVDINKNHIADMGYWYGIAGDKPVMGLFR